MTFLLADVAGSAQPLETGPAAMAAAFASWRELLGSTIERHGGIRPAGLQSHGEAAIFTRAPDALAAALAAHAAQGAHDGPTTTRPSMRIALHSGEAQLRDDGSHFGPALGRCARLRAIARGGQTLITRSAHDSVVDHLPDRVELVDLGLHRLPDLGPAERVFAAVRQGHPRPLEPPRSLDVWPNNLPAQLTSFVGRERELREVDGALAASRMVVLTGAGGCGKTRLALQAAADCLERHPDGTWCVQLAPLVDGELIGSALADVLGVRATAGRTPLEAAVKRLANAHALVLLDNCEHLLAASTDVCKALLGGCPQVTVLATSRSPLKVSGECVWPVAPLSLPPEELVDSVNMVTQADAARLFVERAEEVRASFAVTRENAPAIAQICRDLDGIPLAIELAAARVRVLSPEQIADGLGDRFRLLTSGAPSLTPRQRTLRASVDWSHDLLSNPERSLLRRLAVFTGDWSLTAIEQVCAGDGLRDEEILDLLTGLVDMSLVIAVERRGAVRYRMLETIREYALHRLRESGELTTLRGRHLDAFETLAQRAAPELVTPDQAGWLDALDTDAADLTAAVQHATETDPARALGLCATLIWWWMRGHLVAGELACARALAAAEPDPSPARGQVCWGRALIARHVGNYAASVQYAGEALAIAEAVEDNSTLGRALWSISALQLYPDPVGSRAGLERAMGVAEEIGDDWLLAHSTSTLAYSYLFTDEIAEAERLFHRGLPLIARIGAEDLAWYWVGLTWGPAFRVEPQRCIEFGEQAVAAAREIGDPVPAGFAHNFMAALEIAQGRPEAAVARLQESKTHLLAGGAGMALVPGEIHLAGARAALGALDEARDLLEAVVAGDADGGYNLAMALVGLGGVLRVQGDLAGAAERSRAALEIGERIHSRNLCAGSREVLARVAAARGEWDEANLLVHEALAERAEAGLRLFLPQTLDLLAQVAAGFGAHERATRLLGTATRARNDLGLVRWPPDEPAFGELEERLRGALGSDSYETAHLQGTAMTLDAAIAWARRARGRRRRPAEGWESLTPTEMQVVLLVSEGLTNPQIGERMFISRATVKVHLAHVFRKLSVRTRAELTALAVRRRT